MIKQDATRHLMAQRLRRLQVGVRVTEVDQACQAGWPETVERLLNPADESAEFQAAETALRQTALATGNITDLKAWWLYRLVHSAQSLQEKLTLLWHNHFATSYAKVLSIPYMLQQNQLLRQHACGSFHDLLHQMARDPAMLVWLDGSANRKRHPNENFAREVMELFSLGIGNYTEHDIQEAARAFSGWQLRDGAFWFNEAQHDRGAKTLFQQTGHFQGDDVLNLCLAQPAARRFIGSRLVNTFLGPEADVSIIDATAQQLADQQWQLKPVLQWLLTTPEFDAAVTRQSIIKSPIDLVVGTLRTLADRIAWPAVIECCRQLGQDLFEPPSVKGWDGGRLWLHTAACLQRLNFLQEFVGGAQYGQLDETGWFRAADPLSEWPTLLIGTPLDPSAQHDLQQLWSQAKGSEDDRRRSVLLALLSLPEYQLM
jgi:uncharacterized protein (DUF1800 family)